MRSLTEPAASDYRSSNCATLFDLLQPLVERRNAFGQRFELLGEPLLKLEQHCRRIRVARLTIVDALRTRLQLIREFVQTLKNVFDRRKVSACPMMQSSALRRSNCTEIRMRRLLSDRLQQRIRAGIPARFKFIDSVLFRLDQVDQFGCRQLTTVRSQLVGNLRHDSVLADPPHDEIKFTDLQQIARVQCRAPLDAAVDLDLGRWSDGVQTRLLPVKMNHAQQIGNALSAQLQVAVFPPADDESFDRKGTLRKSCDSAGNL